MSIGRRAKLASDGQPLPEVEPAWDAAQATAESMKECVADWCAEAAGVRVQGWSDVGSTQ